MHHFDATHTSVNAAPALAPSNEEQPTARQINSGKPDSTATTVAPEATYKVTHTTPMGLPCVNVPPVLQPTQ